MLQIIPSLHLQKGRPSGGRTALTDEVRWMVTPSHPLSCLVQTCSRHFTLDRTPIPNFDSHLDKCVFIGEFILNIVAFFFFYSSDPCESPVFLTAMCADLVHDSRFQKLVKLLLELPLHKMLELKNSQIHLPRL